MKQYNIIKYISILTYNKQYHIINSIIKYITILTYYKQYAINMHKQNNNMTV